MVDDSHVLFASWDGVFAPHAQRKSAARLARERQRAVAAASGAAAAAGGGGCPLLPAARPPPDWAYNSTRYAGVISQHLAPWQEGNLTATAVDMAFWREMFPYANRAERPSLHLALKAGALFYKWQRDADGGGGDDGGGGGGGGGSTGGGDGAPPPGSADAHLLAMLARVAQLVALPDVEVVAHTAPKPKVHSTTRSPYGYRPSPYGYRPSPCDTGRAPAVTGARAEPGARALACGRRRAQRCAGASITYGYSLYYMRLQPPHLRLQPQSHVVTGALAVAVGGACWRDGGRRAVRAAGIARA